MNLYSRFFLVAAMLALPAFSAQASIVRTVEKTFPVKTAGTLYVETQGGAIRVSPSSDSVVKVSARQKIHASTDAEADELLKKLELTMVQAGSDVRLSARYEGQRRGFRLGSRPPVQVEFVVSVPPAFAADVRTSGGSIVIGDLDGKVNARTSGGSIKLGRIGAPVDARTSGGSITLDSAKGDVDLDTSGGSITVGQVAGRADLSTSGGGIRIESVERAVRAKTSGGSIRAAIAGPLKENSELSTSGGSVRVTVDPAAAFRLDAASSGGGVNADGITLKIEDSNRSRTRLAGNVNGGGPLLKLRSSGGTVSVNADNPFNRNERR
jgi:hypothetical protein